MNPKTELFLYHLLWTAERLAQPTYRNLSEGFEAWAYRTGFHRQVRRLETAGYLESRNTSTFDDSRFLKLTEAGRLTALGGRDPEARWGSPWDRKWRLFFFDVPESQRSLRRKFTRSLTRMGCGCLQGSVWISANRPPGIEELFPEDGADCSHLMTLEAESRGPSVDDQMVRAAWDFEGINERYEHHLEVLAQFRSGKTTITADALADWAENENAAWLKAVRPDPLLPKVLLPKDYLGLRSWQKRQTILARAGRAAGKLTDLDAEE